MPFQSVSRWSRRVTQKIGRRVFRIGGQSITKVLNSFGIVETDNLFVHSSLSACGWMRYGPSGVIDVLLQWLGNKKTLVLPTHTYCYPDEEGRCEVFDLAKTESQVGAITNYFWRRPGVARSLHPTHSLAAMGPEQDAIVS